MSIKRVGVLLEKELLRGPKNFLFIFATVVPVAVTLLLSLVFGTFFSGKATLGVVAAGDSAFVQRAEDVGSLIVKEYDSPADLRQAVARGAADLGLVLPADFDARVARGEPTQLTAYVWGESQLQHRAVVGVTVANLIRDIAGQESPVEIVTTAVGDAASRPWEERLLPFIVLMTVLIGGTMLPATSLVDEKQKRTLGALTITPTSIGDVFTTKALFGVIVSVAMAVIILVLNRAFGAHPLLLVFVLTLGATLASVFGVLLGALVGDINTLFATIKGVGILLYAPALVYLFPQVPQWIGRLFPTYYMIEPVVEIAQAGGTWSDVAGDVYILVACIIVLIGVLGVVARRPQAAASAA